MGAEYAGKFRLYQKSDWEKLPAMRWLIKGLIVKHGLTILFGKPKIGKKSFVAISQACAIAAGKPWCGFETRQAKVLYVVGEGFYGILRRQAAWEKFHGSVGDNLRYLRIPINFFDRADVEIALRDLKAQGFEPDFIVIDTLARSMSGGNENDTGDMSQVFELLEVFRSTYDASILIVHHTTKDGDEYRGSSVTHGAADGLIKSESKGLDITLISKGFKDAPEFDTFSVRCDNAVVETEDGYENVLAVKERITTSTTDTFSKPADETEGHAKKLVQVLVQHFPEGAPNHELEEQSGLTGGTFDRALKRAKANGWLVGGGGRGQRYNLNPEKSPSQSPSSPAPPQPLRGLGVMVVSEVTPMGASWGRVGGETDATGCKNPDTTEGDKTADLVGEAIEHLKVAENS